MNAQKIIPPKKYDPVKIGRVLKKIRTQKNLTLLELSLKTRIPQSKLSYIENGKYKKVKIPDIRIIAEALGLELKEILNPSTEKDDPSETMTIRNIETIRSYLLLGRTNEAAKMLRTLEKDLDVKCYPLLLKVKGDYFRSIGHKKDALLQYEKLEAQAQTNEIIITNHLLLETIIASTCTLYEMENVNAAISKSLKLIELLNEYGTNSSYNRYKTIIYHNLSVFYISTLQFSYAQKSAVNALANPAADEAGLKSYIKYLLAIVYFFLEKWNESEQKLYEAIKDFRTQNNTKLLTKALIAQHTFYLHCPKEYSGIHKVLENIIMEGGEECGKACRNNPMYHKIWNFTIEQRLMSGNLEQAKRLIDNMFTLGHNNSKTRYLQAKYFHAVNEQNLFLSSLRQAIKEAETDHEISSHEKGMMILEYLKNTSLEERELINQAILNFEQTQKKTYVILNDILPAPLEL
jgi:transcriptional regulator with XRE-family HTH domain